MHHTPTPACTPQQHSKCLAHCLHLCACVLVCSGTSICRLWMSPSCGARLLARACVHMTSCETSMHSLLPHPALTSRPAAALAVLPPFSSSASSSQPAGRAEQREGCRQTTVSCLGGNQTCSWHASALVPRWLFLPVQSTSVGQAWEGYRYRLPFHAMGNREPLCQPVRQLRARSLPPCTDAQYRAPLWRPIPPAVRARSLLASAPPLRSVAFGFVYPMIRKSPFAASSRCVVTSTCVGAC